MLLTNIPGYLNPNDLLSQFRCPVTDTSNDNYPVTEEPTRDFSSQDPDSDSFQVSPSATAGVDVPNQIGDYSIEELIGSGGMGQVFLAEHVRMQRTVAIKMLPVDRMGDEKAVDRFYDEVRAASRLMHPNIVTAFDAGESEGIHYLAMEYVDGETLTRSVSRNGPMPVGEAAAVIRQAALGLLHAHRAGIVHRDVKPGNLMRASDGTVKVLDLGLARISTSLLGDNQAKQGDSKGRLVGTLAFMSPEQLEDPDSADPRSDIYSLGATLFFLLTAHPPYTGEYLEQVYGHRHGDIPDLMQARDDVDMQFANVFSRMMAKSPDQRYASLDEVIDDLSDYVGQTDAPLWLAEFTHRQTGEEQSTVSGGSTSGTTARVFAIDFGMFYAATAEASPSGGTQMIPAGGETSFLFRMAVAGDSEALVYGSEAMKHRLEFRKDVAHCLPMYIGKPIVERVVGGRQCPPEVLMAMLIRRIKSNAWPGKTMPQATAMTIPGSYDQLHRRSMLQAASMAGLHSVRLVDRSLAAVQSLLVDVDDDSPDALTSLEVAKDETILFVGLTGQASEVAVIRRDASRLHQLATEGHWHTGTLPWQQRLVDLTAETFMKEHGFDPRTSARVASDLQMACERAMNSMLLAPQAVIKIESNGGTKSVSINRRHWLQACEDLAAGLRKSVKKACRDALVSLENIDCCVTMGPLMRISTIRKAVLRGLHEEVKFQSVDRSDAARGAAACLASELPGRRDTAMPPRAVTGQSIGIVVNDSKGRRRILPIIPKGTALPARTNRRLTVGNDRQSMTLSLVESSGVKGDDWQSLGRYDFEVGDSNNRTRMIGFEVNVNGLLSVRAQAPGTPGSTKLDSLPQSTLPEESMDDWITWLDQLR